MTLTIADIARALGVEPMGDASLPVAGLAEPGLAGPDDLALAMSPRYAEALKTGRARAAVVWPDADWQALGLAAAVPVGRPRLAMADLTRSFDPGPGWAMGIHSSALVDGAELGEGVSVGAFSVIGEGAVIGAGSRIGPHVTIAAGARIGPGALIHPGVRIGPRVSIGSGFICHPNAVIGADGFSFVTEATSQVEQVRAGLDDASAAPGQPWRRIHSLGGIEIGDGVEIGAQSAVDYGTVRATRIGEGTKIDNLVQVAHNVVIGRHCLLCGQAAVAGSSVLGDFCVLGGRAGVTDNLVLGDRVVVGTGSIVQRNVAAGQAVQGIPAVRLSTHVASYKAFRRLPRLLDRLARDQNAVSKPGEND